MTTKTTLTQAVQEVLATAGGPLHYKAITAQLEQQGRWEGKSVKTPSNTVNMVLTRNTDLFTRVGEHGSGEYDLVSRTHRHELSGHGTAAHDIRGSLGSISLDDVRKDLAREPLPTPDFPKRPSLLRRIVRAIFG